MVATLPGRTHGLGLFTEPILKTFLPDLLPLAPADPSTGIPWPTGDWHERLAETLVAWTLEDAEPWVEVWWHTDSGFRVIPRST